MVINDFYILMELELFGCTGWLSCPNLRFWACVCPLSVKAHPLSCPGFIKSAVKARGNRRRLFYRDC